jgi:GNAT superfamily N-acetyltransferase
LPGRSGDWYDESVPDLELHRVTREDELPRWWRIDDAAMRTDHVALPADPMSELAPVLAGPLSGKDVELWLAVAEGRDVGCAKLTLALHDNRHVAVLDVVVDPPSRGVGIGRRLVDAMLGRVRELGRTVVQSEVSRPIDAAAEPGAPTRLAQSVGATHADTELRRMLDLSEQEPPGLVAALAAAQRKAEGYTIVRWVDHAADADLADLAALMVVMSTDAPHGDLDVEPEIWDAARYRANEADAAARGRRRFAVAAREDATGRLVGFSDIGVNLTVPEVGYQWDTLVHGEHRGHRLGLLMKQANLEQLRSVSPQTRFINTWNGIDNTPMVSVNEALGYRPMEVMEEWQLRL